MKPDYDMSIHTNQDPRAWAKFFMDTVDGSQMIDEGLMIAWFANAMMAMHDHLVLQGNPINGDHAKFVLDGATAQESGK